MKNNYRVIGKLSEEVIVKYKLQEFAGKIVVIYSDIYIYDHVEKHRNEFVSEKSYQKALAEIDSIIKNPDGVNVDYKKSRIEFVKKLDDNVLVAVRISDKKTMKVKLMYPISKEKYQKKLKTR